MVTAKLTLLQIARELFSETVSEYDEAVRVCLAGPDRQTQADIEAKVRADADYVRRMARARPEFRQVTADFLRPEHQTAQLQQSVTTAKKDACARARALEAVLNLQVRDVVISGEYIVEGRLEPIDPVRLPITIASDLLNGLMPDVMNSRLVGPGIAFAAVNLVQRDAVENTPVSRQDDAAVHRTATKADLEKKYQERMAEFMNTKGQLPTWDEDWGQDDSWGKGQGLTRLRMRALRSKLRPPNAKKGGAPTRNN